MTPALTEWEIAHDLVAYHDVPPDPVAAVLVLHGYAEHAGRHAATMHRLAAAGIAAYAYDHRGHGRSPGTRALVERFDRLVYDSLVMRDLVQRAQPALPLFLFGASMGGLMAARSAQTRPAGLAGVVLIAPALAVGQNEPALKRTAGNLLSAIAPDIPVATLDVTRLSRTESVARDFLADELTHHGGVPARTAAEMMKAGETAIAQAEEWRLPLLIVHGAEDRICAPEGSRRFIEHIDHADATLRIVERGYHEPLNDPGGEELTSDIVTWIRARAAAPSPAR